MPFQANRRYLMVKKLKARTLVKASLAASLLLGACSSGAPAAVQPAVEEETVVAAAREAGPGISFIEGVSAHLNEENYLTETAALNDYEGRITEIVLQANTELPLLPAYESIFENLPHVRFTVIANAYVDEWSPEQLQKGQVAICPSYSSRRGCELPQPDFTIAELEALVERYPNVSLKLYDDDWQVLSAWARDTQLVLLSHDGRQRAISAFGKDRQGINSIDLALGEDLAQEGMFDLAVPDPSVEYAPGDVISNGHITIISSETIALARRGRSDEELEAIFNEIYDSEQTILIKEQTPYFHTDLYISFLSGQNHVAVAQARPGSDKAEGLDRVAAYLESQGLVVERMPVPPGSLTYQNLLMESYAENGEGKAVVYLPDLGDPESLAGAQALYERYGFEVVVIEDIAPVLYEGLGGIRCLTLVTRRE